MSDEHYSLHGKRVWVAGHKGMVGAAVARRLASEDCEVVTVDRTILDLTRQSDVERWLRDLKVDAIVMAAAKVGGIMANQAHPADFLYSNLMIESNVTMAAHQAGVERLLFLGSSCIYPKLASQPIDETSLLAGPLEETNEWYAIAKIAGVKLCQAFRRQFNRDYISAMPTNLYGPGDNFDLTSSHVLAALIRKAHEAKQTRAPSMVIWGSGTPRREFLHVDDCADAIVYLLKSYSDERPINVGCGEDISIRDLADLVKKVVGYSGNVVNDFSKPDGPPRKLLNMDRMRQFGWRPKKELEAGIRDTYNWYLQNCG
jgi:GDP-L-fucose synthase